MRNKAQTSPGRTRKPQFFAERLMPLNHSVVMIFIRMVVIPVNGLHIVRHSRNDFVGQLKLFRIIQAVVCGFDEHIRPEQARKAVFIGNFGNLFEMFFEYLVSRNVSVFVEISSEPYRVRFVHTDMNFSRSVIFGGERKHFIYQFVSRGFVDEQNIVCIDALFAVLLPSDHCRQMRESLYTRNEFHSLIFRIRVESFYLFARIPPAHIAEIFFVFQLVGIFGIDH